MAKGLPIIEVKKVTVGYGDTPILKDVSFEVFEGEIFAILGGSGCGKTTLFKVMTGLMEPLSGEVFIEGEKVLPLLDGGTNPLLRKIGVLFQSGALFSSMTLAENVAVPIHQHTNLNDETTELLVALKLLEVGLSGYERFLPSEISGGMQKRAALARAMALDPKILFFDEPSAGLDPVTSARLDQMISRINSGFGTTMVMVTHELASVFNIAQRVILLDHEEKNIIAEGVPTDLMEHSQDQRVTDFFRRTVSEE